MLVKRSMEFFLVSFFLSFDPMWLQDRFYLS